MAEIGPLDLERPEILPKGRHHLKVLWIQAPPSKVVEGVVVSAEQQTIRAPVAAVIADRNDVRRLYDLWWGIAKAAAPFSVPIVTAARNAA